jgi:DNA-binding MarR family transcriptional regulator
LFYYGLLIQFANVIEMSNIIADNAASQEFMPLVRELVRAYQAFASFDATGHRLSGSDLTVSQADVIFKLGNTEGMTCREIGARTLITKGTLTGVIDRLENKGLVERWADEQDGRKTIVALTRLGGRVFSREYPRHVALLKTRFDQLSETDLQQAVRSLRQIRSLF